MASISYNIVFATVVLWHAASVMAELKLASPNMSLATKQHQAVVSPFSHGHQGCRLLMEQCYSDYAAAFYSANWLTWRMGFSVCCSGSGYTAKFCKALTDELFDFSQVPAGMGFGLDDLVTQSDQLYLTDFCNEAGNLLNAHFAHTPFVSPFPNKTAPCAQKAKEEAKGFAVKGEMVSCYGEKKCWDQLSKGAREMLLNAARRPVGFFFTSHAMPFATFSLPALLAAFAAAVAL